ncbi:hypothetical protein N9Z72_00310 [Akkermansiaceae bacterium]|nr:hypothetical protein [Akkermansiaceae bacterium]|tara:strand:- start:327 stop:1376 length:1050 start_codon:yes stop_codon:yes gene_type:complete
MAKQNKKTLKGYFETGDVPNQTQYQHLIDSQLNLAETGTQILVGTLSSSFLEIENHITASGNIRVSGSEGNIHLNINGQITASGNISSSGTIISDNSLIVNRQYFEAYGGSNIHLSKVGNNLALANGGLTTSEITASGNISASGGIVASSATIKGHLTGKNSGLSDSHLTGFTNIQGYGNFTMGNYDTDSHLITGKTNFVGNVTASGTGFSTQEISLANNSKIISENQSNTYILLNNDDYWKINANNINVAQFTSQGLIINEDSVASCNFRVESNNNTHTFFINAQEDKVAIGTDTVSDSLLTVHGNISGSGNLKIDGSQVDFTNLPTSDPSAPGRLYREGTDLKISLG